MHFICAPKSTAGIPTDDNMPSFADNFIVCRQLLSLADNYHRLPTIVVVYRSLLVLRN
jgi:hypothetical protein